jgi:hypothetical protein
MYVFGFGLLNGTTGTSTLTPLYVLYPLLCFMFYVLKPEFFKFHDLDG